MTEEINWRFNPGDRLGINDSGIETFRGQMITSLGREICQNSMRKLYFLKQDALEILRSNIKNNLSKYKEPTNEWIYDFFDGEDPFLEFKNSAPDFKLTKRRGGNSELEVENAKILYTNLKGILTPSQASDERFWAGLAHWSLLGIYA